MLAAISPAAYNYEETLNTLQYADRAKAIQLKARKNETMTEVGKLKAEIEELKAALAAQAAGGGGGGGGPGGGVLRRCRRKCAGSDRRLQPDDEAVVRGEGADGAGAHPAQFLRNSAAQFCRAIL